MKTLFEIIILIILLILLFTSCNSCTQGSAQSKDENAVLQYNEDTMFYYDSNIKKDTVILVITDDNDTIKTVPTVIETKIEPMQVDSNYRIKSEMQYKQLEKTERTLKMQQRKIDSLILEKK